MKRRACVVVASEMTVRAFLVRQLAAMEERYDVTLVVNTSNARLLGELGLRGTLRPLPLRRTISPVHDLIALLALYRLMRRERFDLVHSMTPKAGLLGMVSAWLTRTPVRLHTFTGQVWATRHGVSRAALKLLDKVVARCATVALTDSPSQRDVLIREGIVAPARLVVLGKGSVSGVDAARFRPDAAARRRIRSALAIPEQAIVLLFVGRLTTDKGVLDLARAFAILAGERADVHLLVAGPDEQQLRPAMRQLCAGHLPRVHFLDFTGEPEAVMAASDVLCLPSYREGFGSVIVEAAAAGLPAVASRIYGIVDAVEEDRTGLLHEPGNVDELVARLRRVLGDPALRSSLGAAGRLRVERDFSQARLTAALMDLIASLLDGVPAARNVALGAPAVGESGRGKSGDTAGRGRTMSRRGWYPRYGKRVLDITGATAGIVLLAPLAACVALLVRFSLGSPVLFRQRRPGLHGKPFLLVKFRSMADRYDQAGRLLPDSERLTSFGRFLRATSLDELPELWHVLTGDMSLVGPRPLLMEYLPRYSAEQARRHDVRPGMTGLAQVSGRNALSWVERFELDGAYVERCSLALDLRILARTAVAVLARGGITQPGRATVDYFEGNTQANG